MTNELTTAAATGLSRFLGKEVEFDPQPYGKRTVLVESIEPREGSDRFTVKGRVTKGEEISRIGAHRSSVDITGRHETIYGVYLDELEQSFIVQCRCG